MSTQLTQEQLTKAAEAINETLFERVYVPAFVKFAAEKGINIRSEDDLAEALSIAEMSEQYANSQGSGLLKQAAADLRGLVHGQPAPQPNAAVNDMVKQAAADPAVLKAITSAVQLEQILADAKK